MRAKNSRTVRSCWPELGFRALDEARQQLPGSFEVGVPSVGTIRPQSRKYSGCRLPVSIRNEIVGVPLGHSPIALEVLVSIHMVVVPLEKGDLWRMTHQRSFLKAWNRSALQGF